MGYRRITSRGVRPKQPYAPLYEYYWLYAAVEPKTGEQLFLELPALDRDGFGVFLGELARAYPERPWSGGARRGPGAHRARREGARERGAASAAGLQPGAVVRRRRRWLALRQQLDVFDEAVRSCLEALREQVAEKVRALTCEQVRSLTGYSYILSALNLAQ